MAAVNPPVVNFTGGIIGGELHNRVDIQTYPVGSEIMDNFRPTLQGVMQRRPAMLYVDTLPATGAVEVYPFRVSTEESYLVFAAPEGFKFYHNDGRLQVPAVTSTVPPTSSWANRSTAPANITFSGDIVILDSDGANPAIVEIPLNITTGAVRHTLRFEVVHGPVNVRIGTSSGEDDVFVYTRLRAGHHHLSFTPATTGTYYLQFWHVNNAGRSIRTTVSFHPAGDFVVPCPFSAAALSRVHIQQIRDVLYMVHGDYWPRRLERRGPASWSLTRLLPDDGPFGDLNTSQIELIPSGTNGEINLDASEPYFTPTDVGVLYEISGAGQTRYKSITTGDTWTSGIKVTGVGSAARSITYHVSGSFVGEVWLQRSSGNEHSYSDVGSAITAPGSWAYYDALDNQTWFYRLGVKPGGITSGTAVVEMVYAGGSSSGVVRVVQYVSATRVIAEVIEGKSLARPLATRAWKRGDWNADDGFPTTISDGFSRLWFGRRDKLWASKSDNLTSFESVVDEADSSFSRNVLAPTSDGVRWLAMLGHLVVGTGALEKIGLGHTTADPIGPTNFQFLPGSNEGGAAIQPVAVGGSVLYVHRSQRRLMQFVQNPKALSEHAYISVDLTARAPEIMDARIVDIAMQSEPERRVYVVLESGKLLELLFRREGELDVVSWSTVATEGRVERVCVLPRHDEDVVYLVVKRRTASGAWARYLERYNPERPLMDCDRFHLDAAISYRLYKYDTTLAPSGTSGTITVTADQDVFVPGDVGAVLWLNGGRGTITAVASATQATITVTSRLTTSEPCAPGRWGMRQPVNLLSGATHLAGQTVQVWGDMADLGQFTVSPAGEITLPVAVSVAHVGLPVRSRWRSLKLSYGAQKGTALGMRKAIKGVILLLYKTGAHLQYGKAFDRLRPVPLRTAEVPWGEPVPLFSGELDHAFDSHYEPDARFCLQVAGASPATICGFVPLIDEKDR